MESNNSIERRYYVKILFDKNSKYPSLAECAYFKDGMTLDFYMRWQWYFLYREALLRVQNPHSYVKLSNGSYDYILPEDIHKKKVRDLLTAAKRKKTEFQNKINYAVKHWDELFPIEEHPKWNKVQEKLNYYIERVNLLSEEYAQITKEEIAVNE